MKRIPLLVFVFFHAIFTSNSQQTYENPLMGDKFYLEVGLYLPTRSVQVRADGSTPNDEIDFSETFGLDDNLSTPFFRAQWNFSRKWKTELEYFGVNTGQSATLQEDITFKDITIEQGTMARAGVEFDLYRLFFGRKLLDRPRHILGAGLGVHAMQVGAFVEGEVRSSEGDLSFEKRRVSMLLPLPNIGGWYNYALSSKWLIHARLDWFYITISDYSGGLWNIAPGIKYQIIRNLGIGVDYRFFYLTARMDVEDWSGKFKMDFSGPSFSIHGNF